MTLAREMCTLDAQDNAIHGDRAACVAVDCVSKYMGARNWYNVTSGLCQPAVICSHSEVLLVHLSSFFEELSLRAHLCQIYMSNNNTCAGPTYSMPITNSSTPPDPFVPVSVTRSKVLLFLNDLTSLQSDYELRGTWHLPELFMHLSRWLHNSFQSASTRFSPLIKQ